jgi:hypothetical protein
MGRKLKTSNRDAINLAMFVFSAEDGGSMFFWSLVQSVLLPVCHILGGGGGADDLGGKLEKKIYFKTIVQFTNLTVQRGFKCAAREK